MINVNTELSPRDGALIAAAKVLDRLIEKRHNGNVLIEFEMLNGSIIATYSEHKDKIYTAQRKN